MIMRKIAVRAAGVCAGAATRVCVNLVEDKADGLIVRPVLSSPSKKEEERGPAVRREPGVWPAVSWRAVAAGEMWQPLERFTAKDADAVSVAPLSQAELKRYSAAAMVTYRALCARTEEAGLFMQPVLARYRLTDADGRTLYVSQPAAVGLPEGWQCVEPVEAAVTQLAQGIEIGEALVRAQTFSLIAELPDFSAWPEVSLVELEVSGMLHPVDGSKDAAVAVRKSQSGSSVAAIGLPGATSWLSDLSRWRARRVEELLARCDPMMRTVRRLPAMSGEVTLPPVPSDADGAWMTSPETDAGVADAREREERECRSPHGMIARVEGRAGDTVVWAGITPLPWPGPHPAEILVFQEEKEEREQVEVVTRVWFGKRALSRGGSMEVAQGATLSLIPALTYPHPGATKIEVIAIRSERKERAVVELRPSASMSRAVWVSPGLRPLALTEWSGEDEEPEEFVAAEREGMVVVCSADSPAEPAATATVCGGRVNGLIAADRSLSSWDSARGRMYLLTSEGVMGLTASAERREIAAMMLTPQRLNGVASCGGIIYAAGSRGVMRLAGATLSLVAATPSAVEAICGDEATGLVVMRLADGEMRAMDTDGVMTTVAEPREAIEWEATVTTQPGERLTEALIGLRAEHFSGVVEIYGAGPGGRVRLVGLQIEGAVERPLLVRRIAAPHRARLTVRVAGSGDALRITGAKLKVMSDK